MIRHIVFFTVPDRSCIDAVRAGLSILTEIPHARRLEIGTNLRSDQLSTEIDLVVYGEFDDEAALAAYKTHPLYQTSIERVRPLREMRIAVDYDVAAAASPGLRGRLSRR